KIDYKSQGYTDLEDLYQRNPQLYIEYNVTDVERVERMEEKLGMIKMIFAMSYDAKVNYNDSFTTVRLWDTIIHNYLLDRGIVVPIKDRGDKSGSIIGAYVKEVT